jgi:hypothetical protein
MNKKALFMDYIRYKYSGFNTVLTSSLKEELLLSPAEYLTIKKEVAASLGKKSCPEEITIDMFDSLVELHL